MRYEDQVQAELDRQYDALTARIAAIDRDLATELDSERRLALADKRTQADQERRVVVDQIGMPPSRASAATATKGGRVDIDELTRLYYQIRTDLAILQNQFSEHLARCQTESAGFPVHVLTFVAVGGVATLLLLVFLVVRIGVP